MTECASGINAALAELQTQLPRIAKDLTAKVETRDGGSYRYTYANLAQVSQQVLPLLGKLGLSFTSRPTDHEGRFVLRYELRHVSGESIDGMYPLPAPERAGPREVGGAITYARRYALCAVTGAAPDDDDDDAAQADQAATRRQGRETRRGRQQPVKDGREPGITGDQQRRMQTAFQALGLAGKDDRLRYAVGVVQRPLNSSTQLTAAEADSVIAQAEAEVAARPTAPPGGDPV